MHPAPAPSGHEIRRADAQTLARTHLRAVVLFAEGLASPSCRHRCPHARPEGEGEGEGGSEGEGEDEGKGEGTGEVEVEGGGDREQTFTAGISPQLAPHPQP